MELIFKVSVQLHGACAEEKQVLIDTTVQEKISLTQQMES